MSVAYHYGGADGVSQVIYGAVDGHLIELWWIGTAPVQGRNLTAACGAPPAASDPAAYYNPEAESNYVLYASADGHLHELRWTQASDVPTHDDLTVVAGAPPVSPIQLTRGLRRRYGRPAAFFLRGSRTRHAVFKGQDGHVHEIIRGYRRAPGGVVVGGGGTVVVNG
jgi:hypothetical protein